MVTNLHRQRLYVSQSKWWLILNLQLSAMLVCNCRAFTINVRHARGNLPSRRILRQSNSNRFFSASNSNIHSKDKDYVSYNQLRHQVNKIRQSTVFAATTSTDNSDISPTFTALPKLLSNHELAKQRLRVAREKREAHQKSIQQKFERNLRFKNLLYDSNNNNNTSLEDNYSIQSTFNNDNGIVVVNSDPLLYAVKVTVCNDLRQELKLSGREKRGRVFIEKYTSSSENNDGDNNATNVENLTLKRLQHELHDFFRSLKKGTYRLRGSLPDVADDGTIAAIENHTSHSWPIENDEHVAMTFEKADDLFAQHKNVLKRPSIVIHVERDPNAPPPPPLPHYLQNMADPTDPTSTVSMLSFYAFPPQGIANPDDFGSMLKSLWKPFNALGRVYVAHEGVNAQMSVPTNVLQNFIECCNSIPELDKNMENGINVDPQPLTRAQFATAGLRNAEPPFTNLHIRVRQQIVADGLDQPLNWQSTGYDMPPSEWHAILQQKLNKSNSTMTANNSDSGSSNDNKPTPILLDCRNSYETDVGCFEGAEPLNTVNFRDSWDVLQQRLENVPKDAPIMTYCTGGIRCVKVGAYLTQELGFTNVSRLAGGIVAYDRALQTELVQQDSLFKGTNFVFDGRLGRPITDDSLGTCLTCGAETSLVSNCCNSNCHKRMIQCEACRTSFHGTCSDACKNRLINGVTQPREISTFSTVAIKSETIEKPIFTSIDDYSSGYSSPTQPVYAELEHNTRYLIPSGSHMVAGAAQGRLLTHFASMTREGRILELGTFTGYSTACLLQGAMQVAEVTRTSGSATSGPYVMTMERDSKAFNVVVAQLRIIAEQGFGEEAAQALCALRGSDDVPSIHDTIVSLKTSSNKTKATATCDLIHVTDALATLESIAAGLDTVSIPLPIAPFDMVFVDADKTRLLDYVEACLSNDRVLKRGGLIVVDNVLWKGLVLEAQKSNGDNNLPNRQDSATSDAGWRQNRRARKLANTMHAFNRAIVQDNRVEVLLLPIRDGLSVIRKK